jgi:hypothetical protein
MGSELCRQNTPAVCPDVVEFSTNLARDDTFDGHWQQPNHLFWVRDGMGSRKGIFLCLLRAQRIKVYKVWSDL